jgi:GntR family transcriptional regulator / MocR family aminotransferase
VGRRTDAAIVEDDHDAEDRYDREPIGAVQGPGLGQRAVLSVSWVRQAEEGERPGWVTTDVS